MKKIFLLLVTIYSLFSYDLESISNARLAGQMIFIGVKGKAVNEYSVKKLGQEASLGRLGGVVFNKDNFTDFLQAKKLVDRFKHIALVNPLFLSYEENNEEKQDFAILKMPNFNPLININQSRLAYTKQALFLNNLGLNLYLSVDLNLNLNKDFYKQIIYSQEFANSLKQNNIFVSVANFPSNFAAKDFVVESYNINSLKPFYDFIQLDLIDFVELSHLKFLNFDNTQALFSKKIISILRNDLSFNKVIISDDILGGSLDEVDFKDRIIKAINAGVDVLYFSMPQIKYGDTATYVVSVITKAVDDGLISRKRLEESYLRIINLKDKIK
ncbi:hypothetical protein AVCANL279_00300 [Campylobacter canadensis]|uniref:glycoside hydrolase family 3 N-terminal domain-containing protein n=1 Tax=Campylobacter canadensis TaxID=449520 RepID=UPI001556E045|nr:glycoside hydrolase family 3 N-terminal domain-containing protein [Campylobacter canadensis]MBZ7994242.1 hypothetical protein [Campylobacter canadensis]MBZ7995766.1 hypothetical protein [Campylobacter canadensis]MBZ7999574.1 hypothetical protein [Campylobacter canadensis]MBZ8001339.1 hypothetical protein [Campylobacter canadensis]